MKNIKLKLWVKILLVMLVITTAVAFATRRNQAGEVIVRIDDEQDGAFINKADVLAIASEQGFTQGSTVQKRLNLKDLENKIKEVGFVGDCEVSRDLRGNLIIRIRQTQALARVVMSKGSVYVAKNGIKMPLSKFYTARVPVVTGDGTTHLFKGDSLTKDLGEPLYAILQYIEKDEFWKAQVAQIDINSNKLIDLYMQVGSEKIEFGDTEDYQQKFAKLKVFYEQIIPQKGWNTYKVVKLGFDGQIVCE